MRNLWNGVVNWIAALLASSAGAPHPMVATDDTGAPQRDDQRPDEPTGRALR